MALIGRLFVILFGFLAACLIAGMVVVGAVVGWFFDKQANRSPRPEATKQLGVLLASGLIVGESVILVVISAIVAFSGVAAPLALVGPNGAGVGWM